MDSTFELDQNELADQTPCSTIGIVATQSVSAEMDEFDGFDDDEEDDDVRVGGPEPPLFVGVTHCSTTSRRARSYPWEISGRCGRVWRAESSRSSFAEKPVAPDAAFITAVDSPHTHRSSPTRLAEQ